MQQVAIFVDAGYLFAQGSALIAGAKRPRTELVLDNDAALDRLRALGRSLAPNTRLLRVYWYDAPPRGAPSLEQTQVAEMNDTKLRLGFLNSAGEQKGVDSLIVTDLIELARQQSICDAVLLSGDEDVRIGVQVAQTYGVRVHLIGIAPSRGSQSARLRLEADTTTEWDHDVVSSFLTLRAAPITPPARAGAAQDFADAIAAVTAALTEDEKQALRHFCEQSRGLPPEQDGALLRAAAASLGVGALEEGDRRAARLALRRHVPTSIEFAAKL